MRLINIDNISFKEISKALEDLSWWCDTNEQDGVVYIPSSNLIKDIGRIKDYLEYLKQQPTAYDVDKVVSELEKLQEKANNFYYLDNDSMIEADTYKTAIDIVNQGKVNELSEIKNEAIDNFFKELEKYEEKDGWLHLKMSSIYEIAEELKNNR